jgi:hypothetical protein
MRPIQEEAEESSASGCVCPRYEESSTCYCLRIRPGARRRRTPATGVPAAPVSAPATPPRRVPPLPTSSLLRRMSEAQRRTISAFTTPLRTHATKRAPPATRSCVMPVRAQALP